MLVQASDVPPRQTGIRKFASGKAMLITLCIAIGTIIGELIGIENGFERFGEWLKIKTG
ncbi:MAG: DUF554 family protein, partial [Clostridia bacterium]|nr:DUF554 family protein [Clostridia bacterium]